VKNPQLHVTQSVVVTMVRLATEEVPGVLRIGRGGPRWRAILAGAPIEVKIREGTADVRVTVIARPGQPLGALARQVRGAVCGAIERLLGLQVGTVTVVVDGVGS
jgi:uncharacterized alkaline shock family protein YloU